MKKSVVSCWLLAAGVAMATGARAEDFDAEGNVNPLVVTTSEDVVDPDDGLVSLREAIAYGLDHYTECAPDDFITPEFSTSAFKDGDVRLVLNRAITLDMCEAFADGCTVWIKPGDGQRLTLSTDPLCGGGIFRQAEGTRLRVDDVLFTDCSNFEGSGGVLDSNGRTRFNRCRFENCFAGGVKLVTAAHALESAFAPINELIGLSNVVYGTVLRSIPPDRRWNFTNDTEKAVSWALAACSNTISVLQNAYLSFDERLAVANACMTNFVEMTMNVAGPFNIFCLYAPTIAMRLNAEGIAVDADSLQAALDTAKTSMTAFETIRDSLVCEGALSFTAEGGAIHLGPKAECIVYDASARGCSAFGDGGFLASEGDFKGVNLTLTGNNAIEGGCICNLGGTNQLASVAIVDNVSEKNGAVCVKGGAIGLLNSIVIANEGGNVVTGEGVDDPVVACSLIGKSADSIALGDVFASTAPLEGGDANHLAQLYYPLKPNGSASGAGTFVFFDADPAKEDGADTEWIKTICYSTDSDAMNPVSKPLIGTEEWNTRLLYDLLGQRVESRGMGPVPNVPPEAAGLIVTTFDDSVSADDNKTSLREAAAYAMALDKGVVFDSGLVGGKYQVFPLKNQIVVPSGRTLRISANLISANLGEVTLKPDAGCSNRFFRVERGGRLELNGVIMDGGYAKGDYEVGKRPDDDDDGGAICSEGTLVLTGCTVQNCYAKGYGGAVWSNGGMTATRCTFMENFAQRGGGVCSSDEELRLSGVALTGNTAQDYGGGLYIETGSNDVVATGMTITGNTANGETVPAGTNRGGGVYLTENLSACPGTVTISGTVADNVGGNDSRDGGTEPESPGQTSETPGQVEPPFKPHKPILHLMSAVNALAATPALVPPPCARSTKGSSTPLRTRLKRRSRGTPCGLSARPVRMISRSARSSRWI